MAELKRPKAHLAELTGQTLPIRVYGSAWSHRLLPDPVALRLAELRGWLKWFVVPRRRAEALELGGAIRGVASARFARRQPIEDAVRAERVDEADCRWVPMGDSVDVPGNVEVEVAGSPARVRSGIARLALETGSPILAIVTLRGGWGCVGTISGPIDPAGLTTR